MSEAKECSGIQFKHGSLKDILEELDKLYNASSLKASVGQKLVKDVQDYCDNVDRFYKDSRGCLQNVFVHAKEIRGSILRSSGIYDEYDNFDAVHKNHDECGEKIANALKTCLPKAFSALYYLYFMGTKDLWSDDWGVWWDNKCDGQSGGGRKLNEWLTGQKGQNAGFVSRGFSRDQSYKLSENTGQVVATAIGSTLHHNTPGDLQKALSYLMFVCEWNDAFLGHVLLFLVKFCEEVEKNSKDRLRRMLTGEFPTISYGTLKSVCSQLKGKLTRLVQGSSGFCAVSKMEEVEHPFEKVWDESKFGEYVKWLKDNLDKIIKSLREMSSDANGWNSSNLRSADSAGPFKYGLVFKDVWNGNNLKSKLQPAITSLLASLDKLKQCLQGSTVSSVQVEQSRNSGVSEQSANVSSPGSPSSGSGYHASHNDHSHEDSQEDSSSPSTTSIVGASVGTLGGTAALGGLGYFLRGFLFGV